MRRKLLFPAMLAVLTLSFVTTTGCSGNKEPSMPETVVPPPEGGDDVDENTG